MSNTRPKKRRAGQPRKKSALTKKQRVFYEAQMRDFPKRLFKGDVKRELIAKGLLSPDGLVMTKEELALYEAHTKGFLDRLFSGKVAEDLLAKRVLEELLQPRTPKNPRKLRNRRNKKSG